MTNFKLNELKHNVPIIEKDSGDIHYNLITAMDLDEAYEAAIKLLLSTTPTPEKLVQFRRQLERTGQILDISLQSWRTHLEEVENQATRLKEEHPATIAKNAWASPETLSGALYRLQAYDEDLIQIRMRALSPVFHDLSLASNFRHICSAIVRQPIGPETRSWQLISAVVEAEARMKGVLELAETLEKKVTKMFEAVMISRHALADRIESSHFALACMGAATIDTLKEMANESADLDDYQRDELDELYGEGIQSIDRIMERVEGRINMLHWQMCKLGLKVARQTMIFEYCGVPYV